MAKFVITLAVPKQFEIEASDRHAAESIARDVMDSLDEEYKNATGKRFISRLIESHEKRVSPIKKGPGIRGRVR